MASLWRNRHLEVSRRASEISIGDRKRQKISGSSRALSKIYSNPLFGDARCLSLVRRAQSTCQIEDIKDHRFGRFFMLSLRHKITILDPKKMLAIFITLLSFKYDK